MFVYRLSRRKFALPLSGMGAAIKGARWNSAGVEMIYTAQNQALALAEVMVHFSAGSVPADYVMITIEIPDSLPINTMPEHELPAGWNLFPPPSSTQHVGDTFVLENNYPLLKIPSVVISGEYNILINPRHPDFATISVVSVESFTFDRRLFK